MQVSIENVTFFREMWFACSSSEEWWRTNRNYINSLAVTSVLGYLIGLGDRHPDNILIDFDTGDVSYVLSATETLSDK